MAATGAVQPITLPFGGAAPLCHMHADDTTIHAASPADCDKIIAGPVAVFTAASGAQLNPTKTKALLFGSHARQDLGEGGKGVDESDGKVNLISSRFLRATT